MSISSEITRISNAKTAIASSIAAKGVTVPSGTKISGMSALINKIAVKGKWTRPSDWPNRVSSWSDGIYLIYKNDESMETIDRYAGFKFAGSNLNLSSATLGHINGSSFVADTDAVTLSTSYISWELSNYDYEYMAVKLDLYCDWDEEQYTLITGMTFGSSDTSSARSSTSFRQPIIEIYGSALLNNIYKMKNMYQHGVINVELNAEAIEDGTDITSLSAMFSGCYALEHVDIGYCMEDAITDLSSMFKNCYSLKYISIPSALPQTLASMFYGCSSLESYDGEIFTYNSDEWPVTDMSSMFYGCKSLKEVYFGFDMPYVTTSANMFNGCSSLVSFDITPYDFGTYASSTITTSMFSGCSSLKECIMDAIGLDNISSAASMFSGCTSLRFMSLYHANFSTANGALFSKCTSLTTLDLTGASLNSGGLTTLFTSCTCLSNVSIDSIAAASISFSSSTFLTHDSLVNIIAALEDATSLSTAPVLTLGTKNLARLSAEEKAVATNKGWTLA